MPYKSQAQAGYFHTHQAELEKQGVNVSEWDKASKGLHLPKRAPQKKADGGLVAEGNPLVQGPGPSKQRKPRQLSDRAKTSKVIRQMARDRKRRQKAK